MSRDSCQGLLSNNKSPLLWYRFGRIDAKDGGERQRMKHHKPHVPQQLCVNIGEFYCFLVKQWWARSTLSSVYRQMSERTWSLSPNPFLQIDFWRFWHNLPKNCWPKAIKIIIMPEEWVREEELPLKNNISVSHPQIFYDLRHRILFPVIPFMALCRHFLPT